MLGALDVLVDTPEPRQSPSSGSLAGRLPSVVAREGGPDLRVDQDLIPIPRAVAAVFADLIDASTREQGRNQRNAAALVTGSADGAHPSIKEWGQAYSFFLQWAHVDQHHSKDLPDDATLARRLRVVEDVIEVRLNLFFENLSRVEGLLALANATIGSNEMTGFSSPTVEQVREAIRLTPTPQLRRAFYEGLVNPLWLELLKKEGAFLNPPARITMDDGSIGDPYWPEIEYVARVASRAQHVAVDILLGLKESDNAWVRRALFSIGAAVAASEAARLKPILKAWVASGFGWRTDPHEMVNFAVNLITGGERKLGEWVANALFRPGRQSDSREPDLALEDYWYEVGLPQVVHALGPAGLPMVLGWLIEYQKVSGHLDGSSFSRPSIHERHDLDRDVENALIDAVRDLAVAAVERSPGDTVGLLLGVNSMLARRIAMFATTAALADAGDGADLSSELIDAAHRLMLDPLSNDERCRVDFAELARAVARHDTSALNPLVEFFAAGPEFSADALRERLRRDEDETDSQAELRVADFVERWEHSWLASIGAAALPDVLVLRLAELDDRLGIIEDPLRPPFMITSWTGPNSPLTQDQMARMSPEELVAHLETWHDLGDGWGPEPSHQGQARELTALITANPETLAGARALVKRLRPTYLQAILRAWAAGFKATLNLNWDQVLETVHDVLAHQDELDFPREGGDMDDDPDFVGAKQAAVSLIADLVKKTDLPQVPAEVFSQLADMLMELVPSETAWASYDAEDRESGMDPLTLSLNWLWPIYVRGLATLVGYGPTAPWSDRARIALLTELARTDRRGAVHSVIGESLGRLLNADEAWTTSHIPDWFGDEAGLDHGQQIALSTAMAVHHYHPVLFGLLTPSILSALALPDPMADGWRHHNSTPTRRIGEWAVKALVYGHVDWADPVVAAYFGTVGVCDRGAALGHVAWEFMHAKTVDGGVRNRFADVWDARIAYVEANLSDSAELRQFYWVVRSGKFEAKWWLPRLKRALELDPELATERYMVGEDIAKAADVDPRAAFDVTKLLIGTRHNHGRTLYDLSRNAVPTVIARALAVGDDQLRADATILMNDLGEAGNLDLARQVEALRNGNITQDNLRE